MWGDGAGHAPMPGVRGGGKGRGGEGVMWGARGPRGPGRLAAGVVGGNQPRGSEIQLGHRAGPCFSCLLVFSFSSSSLFRLLGCLFVSPRPGSLPVHALLPLGLPLFGFLLIDVLRPSGPTRHCAQVAESWTQGASTCWLPPHWRAASFWAHSPLCAGRRVVVPLFGFLLIGVLRPSGPTRHCAQVVESWTPWLQGAGE